MNKIVLLVLAASSIYMAFRLLRYSNINSRKFAESRHWIKVPGIVINHDIIGHENIEGWDSYRIKIEYEYRYGENKYTNNRISFGEYVYWSKRRAQKKLTEIIKDKNIDIYLNPNIPEESVIIPIEKGLIGLNFGGIIMGLLALILLIMAYTVQ
jgi:hypothetical protein